MSKQRPKIHLRLVRQPNVRLGDEHHATVLSYLSVVSVVEMLEAIRLRTGADIAAACDVCEEHCGELAVLATKSIELRVGETWHR